jgi:hypothetical protein
MARFGAVSRVLEQLLHKQSNKVRVFMCVREKTASGPTKSNREKGGGGGPSRAPWCGRGSGRAASREEARPLTPPAGARSLEHLRHGPGSFAVEKRGPVTRAPLPASDGGEEGTKWWRNTEAPRPGASLGTDPSRPARSRASGPRSFTSTSSRR